MRILVFVSHRCPHCPKAVAGVKAVAPDYASYGVSFEKIRVKSKRGKLLSSQHGVRSLPTVLFLDDEGVELDRSVGAPRESSLRDKIEKALGIKKSFMDRVLGRK